MDAYVRTCIHIRMHAFSALTDQCTLDVQAGTALPRATCRYMHACMHACMHSLLTYRQVPPYQGRRAAICMHACYRLAKGRRAAIVYAARMHATASCQGDVPLYTYMHACIHAHRQLQPCQGRGANASSPDRYRRHVDVRPQW